LRRLIVTLANVFQSTGLLLPEWEFKSSIISEILPKQAKPAF
jgi:hypothetical protein